MGTMHRSFSETGLPSDRDRLGSIDQFWQKIAAFAFNRTGSITGEAQPAPLQEEIFREAQLKLASSGSLPEATLLFLTDIIGSSPRNWNLFQTALTHRSVGNRDSGTIAPESNQRLEFLGDAVLGLVISTYLYTTYRQGDEGHLSNMRAKIVNSRSLALFAGTLQLGSHLLLGEATAQYHIRTSESALADALESLIGAIYLDLGLEEAYRFVTRHIIGHQGFAALLEAEHNYKSRLVEYTQAHRLPAPLYTVVTESGAEHEKEFTVTVSCGGESLGTGCGKRKKEAEQLAAREAMGRLDKSSGLE